MTLNDVGTENLYDDDDYEVTPVEIGSAGNIRRESDYRSQIEIILPVHFHSMWESRYVSEGRDNLSADGVYSDLILRYETGIFENTRFSSTVVLGINNDCVNDGHNGLDT